MKIQTRIILTATLAALASACTVDSNYSSDNLQNIDTEMTLFENGLAVPIIKNTAQIKVRELIDEIEDPDVKKIFTLTEDGKYEIRYNGYENLDSQIRDLDLAGAIKISPVNIESAFSVEFGDLDPEKFKSEAAEFGESATLPDLSEFLDFKISSPVETIKADTGLTGIDTDISLSVSPISANQMMFSKSTLSTLGNLATTPSVTLPDSEVTLSVDPKSIDPFTIPSNVKKINSVTLKDKARISVSLSLSNNIFTSGTITPDVKVDLSDLLVFTGGSGILDLSSMTPLSASNGFSSTKEFAISGVNVAKLSSSKTITTTGSVSVSGATASKDKCINAQEDLGINIAISFLDFEVESAECEIKDIVSSISKDLTIKLDEVTLPGQVETVDFVTFTEDSKITVNLCATNLSKIPGASLTAQSVSVTFPKELVVSGDNVSNNVLSLSNVNLTEGKTAIIRISKINLPAPVGKKISFSGKINVAAQCTANGTINTADLKNLSGEDISVSATVQSDLKIADCQATTSEYKASVPSAKGSLSFEVPEKAASFGTFTITPKDNPSISIEVTVPDLGEKTISAGDGIKIKVPSFIKLGTVSDSDLAYDKTQSTITVKQIKNKSYSIPVEKIVAKAEKVGNVYKVTGDYEVSGGISVPEGPVNKSTLTKISGASLGFKAKVPSIKAATIAVDSVSFDVNESADFEVLKSSDIPDMLASVGEVVLNDVKANLGIEVKGMPSIGADGKFIVDLKATMPSFLKPSTFEIKGEIKDGKFTSSPLAITGFDLSGFDFQQMKADGENLKGSVKVEGRIYAEDPEIDLSSVSGKIDGKFKAGISGPDDQISIKSISAKLDYQLDTTFCVPMGDISKYLENVHLDLPEVSAVIGIRSNLAIPVSASAEVVPVKNNLEDKSKAISASLDFPYSATPAQSDSVTNSLKLNLNEILNSKCDSLKICFNLKTDKTQNCYIEPEAEYNLGVGYDVSIPLQLKEGTSLEVCDTLDLGGGLSGIEDILSKTTFGIMGDIESTLPIGAKVILEFLSYDKDKDAYKGLPLKAAETDLLEPGKTTHFEISTGPKTPGAELSEITHLRLTVVLTSDGSEIGPDCYIRINNLSIVVPEGITIDPANL